MIYIDETTKHKLPKKYHQSHNIAVVIYDQMAEIFFSARYAPLRSREIVFDRSKDKGIDDIINNRIDLHAWLKLNNRNDDFVFSIACNLFLAVLDDFCKYMYESLSCAMRGKITVAYSLLRKPLTDELLIFEQLLVDKIGFVETFYEQGNPEFYDPSKAQLDKRKIITSAISKLPKNVIFTPEIIYGLRYDKSNKSGINSISNQAIHIVTTDKNYRTEDKSFNFVFLNDDHSMDSFWDHYYYFIPILLSYAATIIDQLILVIDNRGFNIKDKAFKRFLALLISDSNSSNPRVANIVSIIKDHFNFTCKECKKEFKMERADLDLYFHSDLILCPFCFNQVDQEVMLNKINTFQLFI